MTDVAEIVARAVVAEEENWPLVLRDPNIPDERQHAIARALLTALDAAGTL